MSHLAWSALALLAAFACGFSSALALAAPIVALSAVGFALVSGAAWMAAHGGRAG